MNRLLILFASLLVGLAVVVASQPASAQVSATQFVKDNQKTLLDLLAQKKKNDQGITEVFDKLLDYDSLARESLAEHWDERTAEERTEFANTLKRLVQNAYRKNLKKTLDYDVTFDPEKPIDKGILVRTTATHKKNKREEPLSVDYAVHRVGEEWRVFDIVTEGSSLVSNYRSQFRRVIKKKGFKQLLEDMKKKLDKG